MKWITSNDLLVDTDDFRTVEVVRLVNQGWFPTNDDWFLYKEFELGADDLFLRLGNFNSLLVQAFNVSNLIKDGRPECFAPKGAWDSYVVKEIIDSGTASVRICARVYVRYLGFHSRPDLVSYYYGE